MVISLLRVITLVSVLSTTIAHGDTPSQDLSNAIKTWDTRALQVMADQTSDLNQQAAARAILQAFSGQDATAIGSLNGLAASQNLDNDLRFVALNELGRLHLRNQHYVAAVKAFEGAAAAAGNAPSEAIELLKDDLNYARANAAIPPMTVSVKNRDFSSPITRDALDLSRVSATINGRRVDAIMDTGATNSVVSVSTAKRLGLRMVRFDGGVSADGQQISARFAVADTLLFAGREFRNVPFFVLTDEAVNVPLDQGVVGKLDPMIGLSVLRKLGRFEILQRDGKEQFHVGGITTTTGTPAKLLLPEGAPAVLVHVEPEGAELRLSLDTGANRSALTPDAVAALPAVRDQTSKGRVGGANAAGSWVDDAGTLIPQLTLRVGGAAIPLSRVPVGPGPENFDGTLGQDVFRSGGGYVVDFDRMTLEILPTRQGR